MVEAPPRLTTAQAAGRLGVKRATLYAYVARGLVRSERSEGGGSTFDPLEIESLAATGGRRAGRYGSRAMPGRPLMVVDWPLTLLTRDGLFYRGVPAARLADRLGFEDAVAFFWRGPDGDGPIDTRPSALPPTRVAALQAALGPEGGILDRLTVLTVAAAVGDPDRREQGEEPVFRAAQGLLALFAGALAPPGPGAPGAPGETVARRVWRALGGEAPAPGDLALVDAALVLCIDHDLAASTMAARIAASARADLYGCVAAALAALSGSAHGSVSAAAWELITETMRTGRPEAALSRQVAAGRGVPGFGHAVYRGEDPRATALLGRMRGLPRYREVVLAVDRLAEVVRARLGREANLDLALAAMVAGAGGPPEVAQGVFAIGRTAGWAAHVVDEYTKPTLRLRPESRYVGTAPSGS